MTCPRLLPTCNYQLQPYTPFYENEVLEVWLTASKQGHPFISDQFWKTETDTIRNYFLLFAQTWLAVHAEKVLGFISVHRHLIQGLYVRPEEHGKFIGTTLLNKAQESHRSLEVEVYEKNLRARRFYQNFGFVFQNARLHDATNETLLLLQLLD